MKDTTIGLIGLMWHDDTKKKTEKLKIQEAMVYYHEKYKLVTKRIRININSNLDITDTDFEGILIEKVRDVLPNQYWLLPDTT
jgi:hypothetical protein